MNTELIEILHTQLPKLSCSHVPSALRARARGLKNTPKEQHKSWLPSLWKCIPKILWLYLWVFDCGRLGLMIFSRETDRVPCSKHTGTRDAECKWRQILVSLFTFVHLFAFPRPIFFRWVTAPTSAGSRKRCYPDGVRRRGTRASPAHVFHSGHAARDRICIFWGCFQSYRACSSSFFFCGAIWSVIPAEIFVFLFMHAWVRAWELEITAAAPSSSVRHQFFVLP